MQAQPSVTQMMQVVKPVLMSTLKHCQELSFSGRAAVLLLQPESMPRLVM